MTCNNGTVRVLEGLKQVAENALPQPETTIATPMIAGDRLYLRTDGTLYCIGRKQEATERVQTAE